MNHLKHWKTLNSSYLYQTPFGNLRKDTCELPSGQIIQDYYVTEYSDWVNAVVITKNQLLVLVKQYRHGANSSFLEIPAGKPEGNETFEEAVLREVKEETGFTSTSPPILLGEFFVNPATQTNKVISYLITNAELVTKQDLDDTEMIDVHLVDLKRMNHMIKSGEINQLFTVSAYYLSIAKLASLYGFDEAALNQY
ncbi:NUDIX hydrolase [Paenisporosarcina sp.]|uniref:NUDIX hydrolase n=1 Tax=Paenisporosarcina sp. TaxID=1932001 RepID=UPI003C76B1F0